MKYKSELITAIISELTIQSKYLDDANIETLYLGGGTPSLLTADEIKNITDAVYSNYMTEQGGIKEFTIEANPDDLSKDYIKSLKNTDVSRFSIGIQSFREADLRYMNRAHNAQQAEYAIKAAQDAGFTNLTIDLIYGTPGLTDTDWNSNLNKIQEFDIPHFSSYALTVEEGTVLHHTIQKKNATPLDSEQSAEQFELLMEKAHDMGYEHYEISNFCKTGQYAIHNTNYWKGVPYLGIGPSAHSYNNSIRQWNISNNALYLKSILQENKVPCETESLSIGQQLNEYIMTSLRTMWGCDLARIETQFGNDYRNEVLHAAELFIANGSVTLNQNQLTLTKKGKLFADRIAGELFVQS